MNCHSDLSKKVSDKFADKRKEGGMRTEGRMSNRDISLHCYMCNLLCWHGTAAAWVSQKAVHSHTHTHSHTHSHTHTHMLCLQWGSNRGCECISRYSPSVKYWPGVCEIDDSQAAPHPRSHTLTHTELWHIAGGQGSYTNTHTHFPLYFCEYICMYQKHLLNLLHLHVHTHSHRRLYTHPILCLQGCWQAPVVHRYLCSALMPAVCWWTLAGPQGPLYSLGHRRTNIYTHISALGWNT